MTRVKKIIVLISFLVLYFSQGILSQTYSRQLSYGTLKDTITFIGSVEIDSNFRLPVRVNSKKFSGKAYLFINESGNLVYTTGAGDYYTLGKEIGSSKAEDISFVSGKDTVLTMLSGGDVGLGVSNPGANFHVEGSSMYSVGSILGLSSNGLIGVSSSTVDKYTIMSIDQRLPNIEARIPPPSNSSLSGRVFMLSNVGVSSIIVEGVSLSPGTYSIYVWQGGAKGSWQSVTSSSVPLSDIKGALRANTIDNLNHKQQWNWSSGSKDTLFTISADALTTGTALRVSTSSNNYETTTGLLSVENSGISERGVLARFRSNGKDTTKGVTILTSGNVGIGTIVSDSVLTVKGGVEIKGGVKVIGLPSYSKGDSLSNTDSVLVYDHGDKTLKRTTPSVILKSLKVSNGLKKSKDSILLGGVLRERTEIVSSSATPLVVSSSDGIGGLMISSEQGSKAKAMFDLRGSFLLRSKTIPVVVGSKVVGTSKDLDSFSFIVIEPSADNQVLSLPLPSVRAMGRFVRVLNSNGKGYGLSIHGLSITDGGLGELVWNGVEWVPNSSFNIAKVTEASPTDTLLAIGLGGKIGKMPLSRYVDEVRNGITKRGDTIMLGGVLDTATVLMTGDKNSLSIRGLLYDEGKRGDTLLGLSDAGKLRKVSLGRFVDTAVNGLTKRGDSIELGGTLSRALELNLSDKDMTYFGTDKKDTFLFFKGNSNRLGINISDPKATLDLRGSYLLRSKSFSDVYGTGTTVVGSVSDIDSFSMFTIRNSGKSGAILSLPSPKEKLTGRFFKVLNSGVSSRGDSSISIHGLLIDPGGVGELVWNGTEWVANAAVNINGIGTSSETDQLLAVNALGAIGRMPYRRYVDEVRSGITKKGDTIMLGGVLDTATVIEVGGKNSLSIRGLLYDEGGRGDTLLGVSDDGKLRKVSVSRFIDTVRNGLTKRGDTIMLGGVLDTATVLMTGDKNSLSIRGLLYDEGNRGDTLLGLSDDGKLRKVSVSRFIDTVRNGITKRGDTIMLGGVLDTATVLMTGDKNSLSIRGLLYDEGNRGDTLLGVSDDGKLRKVSVNRFIDTVRNGITKRGDTIMLGGVLDTATVLMTGDKNSLSIRGLLYDEGNRGDTLLGVSDDGKLRKVSVSRFIDTAVNGLTKRGDTIMLGGVLDTATVLMTGDKNSLSIRGLLYDEEGRGDTLLGVSDAGKLRKISVSRFIDTVRNGITKRGDTIMLGGVLDTATVLMTGDKNSLSIRGLLYDEGGRGDTLLGVSDDGKLRKVSVGRFIDTVRNGLTKRGDTIMLGGVLDTATVLMTGDKNSLSIRGLGYDEGNRGDTLLGISDAGKLRKVSLGRFVDTAVNGLTKRGDSIELGGTLSRALELNLSDKDMTYFGTDKKDTFLFFKGSNNRLGINTSDPKATIDLRGSYLLRSKSFSGAYSTLSTVVGSVSDIDSFSMFSIRNSGKSGAILSLPSPKEKLTGRFFKVLNSGVSSRGDSSISIHGLLIDPGGVGELVWNGTEWVPNAAVNINGIGTSSETDQLLAVNALGKIGRMPYRRYVDEVRSGITKKGDTIMLGGRLDTATVIEVDSKNSLSIRGLLYDEGNRGDTLLGVSDDGKLRKVSVGRFIDTARNGITKRGDTIMLGGVLDTATVLMTGDKNSLSIRGLGYDEGNRGDTLLGVSDDGKLRKVSVSRFIDTVRNGITKKGDTIMLGGVLDTATVLMTGDKNSLSIRGLLYDEGGRGDTLLGVSDAGKLRKVSVSRFIDTVRNGITKRGDTIMLGGRLDTATVLMTGDKNSLSIRGLLYDEGGRGDTLLGVSDDGKLRKVSVSRFIDTVRNGITKRGDTIMLGGVLDTATVLMTGDKNSLSIRGLLYDEGNRGDTLLGISDAGKLRKVSLGRFVDTAVNGLTKRGDSIELGGTLSRALELNLSDKDMTYFGTDKKDTFLFFKGNSNRLGINTSDPKATIDLRGSYLLRSKSFSGAYSTLSTVVGSVSDIDSFSMFSIRNSGKSGAILSLPSPKEKLTGRFFKVLNSGVSSRGDSSISIHGLLIDPGGVGELVWNGAEWVPNAAVNINGIGTSSETDQLLAVNALGAIGRMPYRRYVDEVRSGITKKGDTIMLGGVLDTATVLMTGDKNSLSIRGLLYDEGGRGDTLLGLSDAGKLRKVSLGRFIDTARNGLTKRGDTIELGGKLIRKTTIDQNNKDLRITTDTGGNFIVYDTAMVIQGSGVGIGKDSARGAIDIAGSEYRLPVVLASPATNGEIDISSTSGSIFHIRPTTGITGVKLASNLSPSDSGRVVSIVNKSKTNSIEIEGITLSSQISARYIWDGESWGIPGALASSIPLSSLTGAVLDTTVSKVVPDAIVITRAPYFLGQNESPIYPIIAEYRSNGTRVKRAGGTFTIAVSNVNVNDGFLNSNVPNHTAISDTNGRASFSNFRFTVIDNGVGVNFVIRENTFGLSDSVTIYVRNDLDTHIIRGGREVVKWKGNTDSMNKIIPFDVIASRPLVGVHTLLVGGGGSGSTSVGGGGGGGEVVEGFDVTIPIDTYYVSIGGGGTPSWKKLEEEPGRMGNPTELKITSNHSLVLKAYGGQGGQWVRNDTIVYGSTGGITRGATLKEVSTPRVPSLPSGYRSYAHGGGINPASRTYSSGGGGGAGGPGVDSDNNRPRIGGRGGAAWQWTNGDGSWFGAGGGGGGFLPNRKNLNLVSAGGIGGGIGNSSIPGGNATSGTGGGGGGAGIILGYSPDRILFGGHGGSGAFGLSLPITKAPNTIDNADNAQEWQWNKATYQDGLVLSSKSQTTGSLLRLSSSSDSLKGSALEVITNSKDTFNKGAVRFKIGNKYGGTGVLIDVPQSISGTALEVKASEDISKLLELSSNKMTTGRAVNISVNGLTSGRGISMEANALSSGTGLSVSTISTGFTGDLIKLSSTGNSVMNTGKMIELTMGGSNSLVGGIYMENSGKGKALEIVSLQNGGYRTVIDSNGFLGLGMSSPRGAIDIKGKEYRSGFRYGITSANQVIDIDAGENTFYIDPSSDILVAGNYSFDTLLAKDSGRIIRVVNKSTTHAAIIETLQMGPQTTATFMWDGSNWSKPVSQAASIPLSSVTGATKEAVINNTNKPVTMTWNTIKTGDALKLSTNSQTTGSLLSLLSTSTTRTGSVLEVQDTSTVSHTRGIVEFHFKSERGGKGFVLHSNLNSGSYAQNINVNNFEGGALDIQAKTQSGEIVRIEADTLSSGTGIGLSTVSKTFTGDMIEVWSKGDARNVTGNMLHLIVDSTNSRGVPIKIDNEGGGNSIDISRKGVREFVIDSAGRVGIGTSIPRSILELQSDTGALILNRVSHTGVVNLATSSYSSPHAPIVGANMIVYDGRANCVRVQEDGVWSKCLAGTGLNQSDYVHPLKGSVVRIAYIGTASTSIFKVANYSDGQYVIFTDANNTVEATVRSAYISFVTRVSNHGFTINNPDQVVWEVNNGAVRPVSYLEGNAEIFYNDNVRVGCWFLDLTKSTGVVSGVQQGLFFYRSSFSEGITWEASSIYAKDNVVFDAGVPYKSRTDTNQNKRPTPNTGDANWEPIVTLQWLPHSSYVTDAIVYQQGIAYRAVANSKGTQPSTDITHASWVPAVSLEWYGLVSYAMNDIVYRQGVPYRAMRVPLSTDTPGRGGVASPWEVVATIEWQENVTYALNSVVYHRGEPYRAIQSTTGNRPDTSKTFWKNINLYPQFITGLYANTSGLDTVSVAGYYIVEDVSSGTSQASLNGVGASNNDILEYDRLGGVGRWTLAATYEEALPLVTVAKGFWSTVQYIVYKANDEWVPLQFNFPTVSNVPLPESRPPGSIEVTRAPYFLRHNVALIFPIDVEYRFGDRRVRHAGGTFTISVLNPNDGNLIFTGGNNTATSDANGRVSFSNFRFNMANPASPTAVTFVITEDVWGLSNTFTMYVRNDLDTHIVRNIGGTNREVVKWVGNPLAGNDSSTIPFNIVQARPLPNQIHTLLVGGGSSGAQKHSGGGGAGEVVEGINVSIDVDNYNIVIGGGGPARPFGTGITPLAGAWGGDTRLRSISQNTSVVTAYAGQPGQRDNNTANSWGSAGGAWFNRRIPVNTGRPTVPSGYTSYVNGGGCSPWSARNSFSGGGGGGAGGAGLNTVFNPYHAGANGGAAWQWTNGDNTWFAGGGGGSGRNGQLAGAGGGGIGGAGNSNSHAGHAVHGTGSGGGAGGYTHSFIGASGSGGSGAFGLSIPIINNTATATVIPPSDADFLRARNVIHNTGGANLREILESIEKTLQHIDNKINAATSSDVRSDGAIQGYGLTY